MECTRHRHSSPNSAKKCWAERARKRCDRAYRMYDPPTTRQVRHDPPAVVPAGPFEVHYFFSAEAT